MPFPLFKVRLACALGTAFEFFEFQIFSMLMPYLVLHFFNGKNNQYFIGYIAFSIAFIARPLGGWLIGYIADHHGRRQALLFSMWLMAISTISIGLLPSFATAGYIVLILLLICRIGQGLSVGGEFTSSAVLLFEHHTGPKCFDLIWQDLGGTLGVFIATLSVWLLSTCFSIDFMQSIGWRLPFFGAFLLSLLGIYVRSNINEPSTHFALTTTNAKYSITTYYLQTLGNFSKMFWLILACAPNGIFWYLQIIFIPNQLLSLSPAFVLLAVFLTLIFIPVGAKLADKYNAYFIWMISVIALCLNFGGFILLSGHPSLQKLIFCLQNIFLAFNQGPRLLILNKSFALNVRAISCSLVFSLANILGGLTPFLALWILEKTSEVQNIFYALIVFCTIAIIAMYKLMQPHHTNAIDPSLVHIKQ